MYLADPVMSITISPKFGLPIEIECPAMEGGLATHSGWGIPTAQLVLHNLAEDMLSDVEGKAKGEAFDYNKIEVRAGYEKRFGTVIKGVVANVKTQWNEGKSKTYITIADEAYSRASHKIVGMAFNRMPAMGIASAVVGQLGLSIGNLMITSADLMSFTAMNGLRALRYIAESTESWLYFVNGSVSIVPKMGAPKPPIGILTEEMLYSPPEKIQGGWRIKSAFNHEIQIGESAIIQDETFSGRLLIKNVEHYFNIGKFSERISIFQGEA